MPKESCETKITNVFKNVNNFILMLVSSSADAIKHWLLIKAEQKHLKCRFNSPVFFKVCLF